MDPKDATHLKQGNKQMKRKKVLLVKIIGVVDFTVNHFKDFLRRVSSRTRSAFVLLSFSASYGSKNSILDIFQELFLCRFQKYPINSIIV